MNAGIHTTTLTIIQGATEDNTIPSEATATVNFRLLPGDTIDEALAYARKVINDDRVHIEPVEGKYNEALPVSPSSGSAYKGVSLVIRQVFENPPAAPYVMLVGTDCQHFVPICDDIFRFTSLVMDERFRGPEHGIDERKEFSEMSNELGVNSAVGKLRKVIVHRPDLSLKRLTPSNHDELLFDQTT